MSRTPWFFSLSSWRVVGTNTSIRSGTLRTMRAAHSAAWESEEEDGEGVSHREKNGGRDGGREGGRKRDRGEGGKRKRKDA